MHFCQDEAIAIMSSIPFLVWARHWIRDRVARLVAKVRR